VLSPQSKTINENRTMKTQMKVIPKPIKHKVRPISGTIHHPLSDLWQARVGVKGMRLSLGYHPTQAMAAAARLGAVKVLLALGLGVGLAVD
jgi:hypothetical protein